MALSLQDKVALIYTSAGSQRRVADLLGLSHQQVGRILKAGQPELGGYVANSRALKNPALIDAVEFGFKLHKQLTKAQAKRDGIQYDPNVPIYARNIPHKDGKPGQRIGAEHTHWLRDELRKAWIVNAFNTRKYAAVSVQSVVSLYDYMEQARGRAYADRMSGNPPTGEAISNAIGLQMNLEAGHKLQLIGTQYTPLQFPAQALPLILADIDDKLRRKHAPATGNDRPGTAYASRIVLQIDSRTRKNDPRPKSRKASGNRRGTGKRSKRSRVRI